MTMSALARSVIGPSSGQRTWASVTGCQVAAQRREALDELGDPGDGPAPQVGLVARGRAPRPSRRGCVVVGEPGQRVVDEVGRRRLAAPVEQQLDGPVRDLAAGDAPATTRTAPGARKWRLARQHLGDVELVDGERRARRAARPARRCRRRRRARSSATKSAIEHERLVVGAPQRLEGALLGRGEHGAALCAMGVTAALSGATWRRPLTRAPRAHDRTHAEPRPRPASPTPHAP